MAIEDPKPVLKDGVDEHVLSIITEYRKEWKKLGIELSNEKYFYILNDKIQESKKNGQFEKMIQYCQQGMMFIEPVIISEKISSWVSNERIEKGKFLSKDEWGSWDNEAYQELCEKYGRYIYADDTIPEMKELNLTGFPPITESLSYFVDRNLKGQLKNLEGIINYFPDLKRLYSVKLEKAYKKI